MPRERLEAALTEASIRWDEALSLSHKDAVPDFKGATTRRLGGLVVTPKAGTAILFYNLDPDDGTPSPAVSGWSVHVHGSRFRKVRNYSCLFYLTPGVTRGAPGR